MHSRTQLVDYGPDILKVLLGSLVTLGGAVLMYWAKLRKSENDHGAAMLQTGVDMHRLAAEQANMIREELRQDLAHAENARRDAEADRDKARRELEAATSDREKWHQRVQELTDELEICRRDRTKLVEILRREVGSDTLEEISDLPEMM